MSLLIGRTYQLPSMMDGKGTQQGIGSWTVRTSEEKVVPKDSRKEEMGSHLNISSWSYKRLNKCLQTFRGNYDQPRILYVN